MKSLNWSEVLIAAGISTYLALLIGGGAIITAILRLRHPEENKSAPLRVLILSASILTSVISILIGVFSARGEPALAFLFVGYLILYPLHAVLVTEPNTVGRRVYYDYKQGRSKFSMFSMPTGGNAVLFSTSLFFVFCFTLFLIDAKEDEVILAGVNTAMVAYFSMLYLSGFFYRWFENWVARLICLVAGPIVFSIISLLPVMIAGFTEEEYIAKLSPFFLMAASFQGEGSYGFIGASLLAITAFIINVPRMTDASRRLKKIREKDAA
ncbi:MAG: hypothetical protein VX278_15560 [Myxococcota bacterium]|nr:hypothetical protein [Myxococcota bacterium]